MILIDDIHPATLLFECSFKYHESLSKTASELFKKKRYGLALKVLEHAIFKLDQRLSDYEYWEKRLLIEYADGLSDIGEHVKSLSIYLRFKKYYSIAKTYILTEKYTLAIKYLKKCDTIDPLTYNTRWIRARIYFIIGDYDNSAKEIQAHHLSYPKAVYTKIDLSILSVLINMNYQTMNEIKQRLTSEGHSFEKQVDNNQINIIRGNILSGFINHRNYYNMKYVVPDISVNDNDLRDIIKSDGFISKRIQDDPLYSVLFELRNYDTRFDRNELDNINHIFILEVENQIANGQKDISNSYIYFIYLIQKNRLEDAMQFLYNSKYIQSWVFLKDLHAAKKKRNQTINAKDIYYSYYIHSFPECVIDSEEYENIIIELISNNIETYLGVLKSWNQDVSNLSLEIANKTREKLFLPKIGEGWASEIGVLQKVKELFIGYRVIYQGSPYWLGNQRFDIYIPELNLAIEYQGEQHYRPIKIFGGDEGYIKTKERDLRKLQLAKSYNVFVEYVKYDDNIKDVLNSIYQKYVLLNERDE
jgi:hypothetical protein